MKEGLLFDPEKEKSFDMDMPVGWECQHCGEVFSDSDIEEMERKGFLCSSGCGCWDWVERKYEYFLDIRRIWKKYRIFKRDGNYDYENKVLINQRRKP